MLARIPPKKTSAEFKPSQIRFLVPRGDGLFDYYPIKLGSVKGLFLAIESTPPIIMDGFIRYNRKLYKATRRDILRKRINVSRSVSYDPATNTTTPVSDSTVGRSPSPSEQLGSGENPDEQICKVADVVFEEQMRTLYGLEDSEAEWERLENTPQPRLAAEGDSV